MQFRTNQIIELENHGEVKGIVQDILPASTKELPNLPEDAHFCGLYFGPDGRGKPLHVFYSESWRTWFPVSSLASKKEGTNQ